MPDWERIEVQYSTGMFSSRRLADMHGLSHTAINKRAREHGWQRDLAKVIQAAADAKVAAESLRQAKRRAMASMSDAEAIQGKELGTGGNIATGNDDQGGNIATRKPRTGDELVDLDHEIVNAESSLQASVRLSHRKDIGQLRAISQRLLTRLGDLCDMDEDELLDAAESIDGDDRAAFKRLAAMPGQIDAAKKLGETMKLAITMEREAFAMDRMSDPGESMGNAITQLLQGMRRSALPVVEVVEDDDEL